MGLSRRDIPRTSTSSDFVFTQPIKSMPCLNTIMASFGQAQARPSRTDGRGLYATDECEPGQLIFAIRPLLATLDLEHARDTCGNCFRSTQYELAADAQDASDQEGAIVAAFKIQKCGGCRVVSYCSKVCSSKFISIALLTCLGMPN